MDLSKIIEKAKNDDEELKKETLSNRNSNFNFKEEYKKNLYIKENMFNKYKDKTCLSDEELKLLIDIKYEEFLIMYLKGELNCKVSKYLNTRLTVYFNKCITLTKKDKMLISITYYDYNNLLNNFTKKLKSISTNDMYKVMLEETYIELIYRYYCFDKKYNIENYINKNLSKKINDLLSNFDKGNFNINYIDEEDIIYNEKRINSLKKEYKKRII